MDHGSVFQLLRILHLLQKRFEYSENIQSLHDILVPKQLKFISIPELFLKIS